MRNICPRVEGIQRRITSALTTALPTDTFRNIRIRLEGIQRRVASTPTLSLIGGSVFLLLGPGFLVAKIVRLRCRPLRL
ncbi:hypothetical protein A5740_10425 [Mycobacterium sp. GA-1841]|nr:hypothetical protein A5740_10425 [Mycobacterium sp. GA-1841]